MTISFNTSFKNIYGHYEFLENAFDEQCFLASTWRQILAFLNNIGPFQVTRRACSKIQVIME